MYRNESESHEQKIQRLERELNLAYQEREPTADDAEIGLALLRFRAQRLTKDIEAFRAKHHGEPLHKRIAQRALRIGRSRAGKTIVVAGAFAMGMGLHAQLTRHDATNDESVAAIVEGIEQSSGALSIPDPTPAPSSTATETSTTTDEPAGTAPEPLPAPPRVSVTAGYSMKEYGELMARSRAFFRAIQKHDGHALAAMVHPRKDLTLLDEHVQLASSVLRDCFTSARTYTVNVSAASEDTEQKTCGAIFDAYTRFPYERSEDVFFNVVPDAPELAVSESDGPFVFFYLPPPDDNELAWQGVQLRFEQYGGEYELTGIEKAYWTP